MIVFYMAIKFCYSLSMKKSAANATLQLYYFVGINYFKAAKTSS